jgi:hypothetical protein
MEQNKQEEIHARGKERRRGEREKLGEGKIKMIAQRCIKCSVISVFNLSFSGLLRRKEPHHYFIICVAYAVRYAEINLERSFEVVSSFSTPLKNQDSR